MRLNVRDLEAIVNRTIGELESFRDTPTLLSTLADLANEFDLLRYALERSYAAQ